MDAHWKIKVETADYHKQGQNKRWRSLLGAGTFTSEARRASAVWPPLWPSMEVGVKGRIRSGSWRMTQITMVLSHHVQVRKQSSGWGGGSVGRELVTQAGGPVFNPWSPEQQ